MSWVSLRQASALAHPLPGELYRVDDLRVAGAAAEVPGERVLDRRVLQRAAVLEVAHAGDDHPRRAEAALHAAQLHHRPLEGVEPAGVSLAQRLHGGDLLAHRLLGVDEAGVHHPPVDDDRARAALALAAALLGAGEAQAADGVQQAGAAREDAGALGAVDLEGELFVLHLVPRAFFMAAAS